MNQQQQIALLAAALEEVGKRPGWIRRGSITGRWLIECVEDSLVYREAAALAALAGVAAEFIARNCHITECHIDNFRVDYFDFNGPTHSSTWHSNYIEALAAAVRVAGKGESK